MKDKSIVLELVVSNNVDDQDLKSFVEDAVREWRAVKESVGNHIDEPIEVTAIADGIAVKSHESTGFGLSWRTYQIL